MVEKEEEHLPRDDYLFRLRNGDLDLDMRTQSLQWIRKVPSHFSFLFKNHLPTVFFFLFDLNIRCGQKDKKKKWMFQLSAVGSLSLAAKLEEVQVPSLLDLQMGGSEFVFEAKTIRRMETMVMSTLKWRIKSSTPYDYVHYFLNNINLDDDIAIDRSVEIISHTIEDIEFLEFRPSEIAAAVAIYVAGELQEYDKDNAFSSITEVDKVRVDRCVVLIGNISSAQTPPNRMDRGASSAPPESPNGVLETTSFSHESDESGVG
ncbi:hypothetical protein M569_10111, partial [Genlisea aurea]